MAGTTGLEPATSAVTGQHSNQLNYVPAMQLDGLRKTASLLTIADFAYSARFARDAWVGGIFRPYRP